VEVTLTVQMLKVMDSFSDTRL